MRHHVARKSIQVLSFLALCFSVDLAIQSGVAPTTIAVAALIGLGFAVLIVRLAHDVLHGNHGRRRAAAIGLNLVAALPVLAALPVVMTTDGPEAVPLLRATLVWLLVTMIWTTLVIAAGLHRSDAPPVARRQPRPRRMANDFPRPAGIR